MHQRSLSELQRVSGTSTPRDRASGRSAQQCHSSRLSRGENLRLCPPTGALLWAWLLLGALVFPGAWSFLTEDQEELLVELHNHYRGVVSPSASAMLPLRWDPSLKLIAEGYAAKCIWNHNPELEDTGENLFVGTGPLDLRVALEKWFLEHLDYEYNNNSCDEDKMCGHYTQMVWADTHRVGCAFHLCNQMEGLDWERVSFLVCNYYPAGNYEGERPYVEGDWCSRCPENLQRCENNLCVAEEEEEEETVTPPPATPDPTDNNKNEEQKEVPPPVSDTTPAPRAPTITSSSSGDADASTPPTPDAPTPEPSSTGKGEEVKEEVKEETKEVEEDMGRKMDKEWSKGQKNKMEEKSRGVKEAHDRGQTSAPPLLLVCLSGLLTLMP
ncbi:peptidase inhibitor 16-like isoform X2 [Sphaeramia orbicularis]|uniref:peptidase inhibitor 16-like isoform X2 n=1 Tax=Sphaeramia orbicularis TaxID=375764 RepID=UPI00117E84FC|nr:peptidase inhibitor 16-like isoform X2 [Sphaeramia orbicularis]